MSIEAGEGEKKERFQSVPFFTGEKNLQRRRERDEEGDRIPEQPEVDERDRLLLRLPFFEEDDVGGNSRPRQPLSLDAAAVGDCGDDDGDDDGRPGGSIWQRSPRHPSSFLSFLLLFVVVCAPEIHSSTAEDEENEPAERE